MWLCCVHDRVCVHETAVLCKWWDMLGGWYGCVVNMMWLFVILSLLCWVPDVALLCFNSARWVKTHSQWTWTTCRLTVQTQLPRSEKRSVCFFLLISWSFVRSHGMIRGGLCARARVCACVCVYVCVCVCIHVHVHGCVLSFNLSFVVVRLVTKSSLLPWAWCQKRIWINCAK